MIAIKGMKMPRGCQHCMYFKKKMFGNGLDYSYSCMQGAKEIPVPWIRQMEERASDCPLVEIVTCKDCKYYRNKGNKYSYCTKRLNVDSITDRYREPDYFCANGERKENEKNN